jgi:hypothetical protein
MDDPFESNSGYAVHPKRECFLSPEALPSAWKGYAMEEFDKQKSDTFTVGMIVLKAGLLEELGDVYEGRKLDGGKLKGKIEKFKEIYRDNVLVTSTVGRMLKVDPKQRTNFEELVEKLPNYKRVKAYFMKTEEKKMSQVKYGKQVEREVSRSRENPVQRELSKYKQYLKHSNKIQAKEEIGPKSIKSKSPRKMRNSTIFGKDNYVQAVRTMKQAQSVPFISNPQNLPFIPRPHQRSSLNPRRDISAIPRTARGYNRQKDKNPLNRTVSLNKRAKSVPISERSTLKADMRGNGVRASQGNLAMNLKLNPCRTSVSPRKPNPLLKHYSSKKSGIRYYNQSRNISKRSLSPLKQNFVRKKNAQNQKINVLKFSATTPNILQERNPQTQNIPTTRPKSKEPIFKRISAPTLNSVILQNPKNSIYLQQPQNPQNPLNPLKRSQTNRQSPNLSKSPENKGYPIEDPRNPYHCEYLRLKRLYDGKSRKDENSSPITVKKTADASLYNSIANTANGDGRSRERRSAAGLRKMEMYKRKISDLLNSPEKRVVTKTVAKVVISGNKERGSSRRSRGVGRSSPVRFSGGSFAASGAALVSPFKGANLGGLRDAGVYLNF